MKKMIILILPLLFLGACTTLHDRKILPDKDQKVLLFSDKDIAENGWMSFSYGVYYANRARATRAADLRAEMYTKALEFFHMAEKSGVGLGRVYYHLSDCYYNLINYDKALEYAKKSVSIDKKNLAPYQRIYSIYMKLRNYKAAAEILESYIAITPSAIHINYVLAEHYYRYMKDSDTAEKYFNKVTELAEQTTSGNYYLERAGQYLGYIEYRKGDYDKALGWFETINEINPENLTSVYMLAMLNMQDMNLDAAEEYADRYLGVIPGNLMMNSISGRVKYIRENPSALKFLQKGRRSKSIEGLLCFGLLKTMTGEIEDAKKILEAVIKNRPTLVSARLALGEIYSKQKEKKKAWNEYVSAGIVLFKGKNYSVAAGSFKKALEHDGNSYEVYYYLGRSYEELQQYSLAILNYKKVFEKNPGIDMLLHIGYLHALNKDYSAAVRYYDLAARTEPENSKPYFFKGLNSIWEKKYPDAERNLKKAIEKEEKSEKYYFYLAITLEKQAKLKEAMDSLERALVHDPESARACNFLGYLYADNNINIDRSLKLIQKALSKEPDNGAYLDSLGWVYYKKGMFEQAIKHLLDAEKKLNEIKSPDSVVYDHIGDTYIKLGKKSSALIYWKKSILIEKKDSIRKKIEDHSD